MVCGCFFISKIPSYNTCPNLFFYDNTRRIIGCVRLDYQQLTIIIHLRGLAMRTCLTVDPIYFMHINTNKTSKSH